MGLFQIIAVTLFVEDAVVWIVGSRALRKARSTRNTQLVFHGFMVVQGVCLSIFALGWSHQVDLDELLPTALCVIVVIWHILVAPAAMVASLLGVLGEAMVGIYRSIIPCRNTVPPLEENSAGMSRREFLGHALALTPPTLTLALSAIAAEQLSHFRTREMSITVPNLPGALDGMTIAHVSDLHLGRFTHGRVVRKVVDAVNALKSDLILFTGDLINDSLTWLPEGIEALQHMDGPLVLCEGNHDLIEDPEEFERRVKASGLKLLVNEAATMKVRGAPVQLLGVRWGGPPNYGQHRHDERGLAASMEALLKQRDPGAFPILLAHHPHAWDYTGDLPLTLSGHTHGGQLMINERLGFGPVMFRYWSGLYTRLAHTPDTTRQTLVVSNGVGNWFPIRTAAPAEIVHLTLRRG